MCKFFLVSKSFLAFFKQAFRKALRLLNNFAPQDLCQSKNFIVDGSGSQYIHIDIVIKPSTKSPP